MRVRSIDEDLEIVRAMFEAFAAGDKERVIALADPGIVLVRQSPVSARDDAANTSGTTG